MFRVARNRIVDAFRKQSHRQTEPLEDVTAHGHGPDDALAREMLLDAYENALAELPPEQREAFIANELEGRSFRELAEQSGVNINTLLARKRYAVLHLRRRLRSFYYEEE